MTNKILSFDKLVAYSRECSGDVFRKVARCRLRHDERFPRKTTFWERIYPKAEVLRLRSFIDNMRNEEHLAAKNALDLYAENELLRQYRTLAQRGPAAFVTTEEHWRVKHELTETQGKLSTVSTALDNQMREWTEYMKKHD